CQAPSSKIFPFRFSENHDHLTASRTLKRGASRSSRVLGAGCDGRGGYARRAWPARTAKSRGPGTPTLVSSFAGDLQGDGGYQARHPGYSIHTFPSLSVVPYLMRRKASRPRRITFGPGLP